MPKKRFAISPTREENFADWYQEVIRSAEMAESTDVRGCMVMRPWGYGLWEQIQADLDSRLKAMGHQNMYFPLLIPLSYLQKEAGHIDGFAKECAVVTHRRLEASNDGVLKPSGPLDEPYVIRPTSETLIGNKLSKWIQSYRDLPLKMNQWANVMRWEMRPRLFLRTSEFLWQEGHTAHATAKEADSQALEMLECYRAFCEEELAMPVWVGEKSEGERFPGADKTYCIEAMMQDGKALQAGTSHFLGQNFSKAFDIAFTDQNEQRQLAWTTSWGVSTRLIGGLIMVHADDNGLRLPPRVTPYQVVILLVVNDESKRGILLDYAEQLQQKLQQMTYASKPIRVHVDQRPGRHAWHWVKKGVPIRLEIGLRELEEQTASLSRRDRDYGEREVLSADGLGVIADHLAEIQSNYFEQADHWRAERTVQLDNSEDFYSYFKGDSPGFVRAFWQPSLEIEERLKQDLRVSVRCMPMKDSQQEEGTCLFSGKKTSTQAFFAKAY